jgi:hypothetical protein
MTELSNKETRELTITELDDVTGGKLGNTKIQTLMSDRNEAQTTLAGIQKALHDTHSTEIGKI